MTETKTDLSETLDSLRAHGRLAVAQAEAAGRGEIALQLTGVLDTLSAIWREAKKV